ncbi:Uncharacterized protein dnm_061920 [Desulfonema magnum]|uniref:Uncharacterized protein n=1 Tax=Desulfonema magnum TaxID=45655 RepID=A0A975GQK2_9BACT|nr:Uncharacterized protein dnm_061920 [Desulfonema magnum]
MHINKNNCIKRTSKSNDKYQSKSFLYIFFPRKGEKPGFFRHGQRVIPGKKPGFFSGQISKIYG